MSCKANKVKNNKKLVVFAIDIEASGMVFPRHGIISIGIHAEMRDSPFTVVKHHRIDIALDKTVQHKTGVDGYQFSLQKGI